MKHTIVLHMALLALFSCPGQETPKDIAKDYSFETEYQYRNMEKAIEKGNEVISFQFTSEKFLKIDFNSAGEFMLIDTEDNFVANNFTGKIKIVPFSGEASGGNNKVTLEYQGTVTHKGYHCDSYHITLGNDLLKFYFEKKESKNFNAIAAKMLAARGFSIDKNQLPKGKLIAGMEVKDGKDIDVMELVSIKENQNIKFKLRTNR